MKSEERLSNRVRECRKRAGIRQSDLAEQVEVTRQTIIAIEKERFNPSVALGLRIARVLGESMDSLFMLAPLEEEPPAGSVVALPDPATVAESIENAEPPDHATPSELSDPSDQSDQSDLSDQSDSPDSPEPSAPPAAPVEPPAPEETFEILATMMGPDEENVSNDPTGPLPSPLDGSVTSPIQGVWDF